MIRSLCLLLILQGLASSIVLAGGVSDGGSKERTEVNCEFPLGEDTIGFTVRHPTSAYGNGINSFIGLLKKGATDGWAFNDDLSFIRKHVKGPAEEIVVQYLEESSSGGSITTELKFFKLSRRERSNLRYIRRDQPWLEYTHAKLSYPRRRLQLRGVCLFE